MLAKIDTTTVAETVAKYLPDLRNVKTADSLDEAREVVSANIYPHRLRAVEPVPKSLMCLTSALDLGECAWATSSTVTMSSSSRAPSRNTCS
jgi:hypothetical protein